MSSPDINYPAQPTYGEGMREALEAQVALLTGTKVGEADFSQFEGGLQQLLQEYEAPIRETTAQIDTDVLRQTLLGSEQKVVQDPETGQFGIPGAEVVTGEDGEPQTAGGGRYQIVMTKAAKPFAPGGARKGSSSGLSPTYTILDIQTGGVETFSESVTSDRIGTAEAATEKALKAVSDKLAELQNTIEEADGDVEAPTREFNFTNPNIPADPSKAGQEGFDSEGRALLQEGDVVRAEDGMIDLLGDKRQVQGSVADYKSYVQGQEDLNAAFIAAKQAGDPRTVEEFGKEHYEKMGGREEGRDLPTMFGDTDRQAGFDAQGNFLGLSALAEDVQAGNLSRQRERDLADVERLSGRFQDVMADYRPGTTEALAGAREVLGQQQQRLTGTRSATQADVDAETATEVGELISTGTSGGFQDPTFSADTQFGGALSAEQADDPKNDPLRAALLRDARGALDEGLTSREERQIAEAARARATMMGRTFDQSEAINEAQARVQEDNLRRMQNRAFASQVLGQEAGLQTGDLGRGMQQELQQVGADMDAERLRQAQTAGFIDASTRLAGLEASTTMDPFAALLNRAGGGSLAAGQGVFGAAGYGLDSGPQYLNPESGLGFISNMAANEASMFGAGLSADASRTAGLASGLGNLVGSGIGAFAAFCWVAREVYGPMNPQWMHFRDWMFAESPRWFFNLYRRFGERFANWISDKPRIKAIIRKWMDSKIGDK